MTTEYSSLSLELTKALSKNIKKEQGIFITPKTIIQKLFGRIDEFVALENIPIHHILEPSCGSAEIVSFADNHYENVEIDAVELNETMFQRISSELEFANSVSMMNQDFTTFVPDKQYDLIVGNPPFVVCRKETVPEQYADYMVGRPNLFGIFIVHSLSMLRPGGILAFIIPRSFLNAAYYSKIRNHLKTVGQILDITDFESDAANVFLETKQATIGLIFRKHPIDYVDKPPAYLLANHQLNRTNTSPGRGPTSSPSNSPSGSKNNSTSASIKTLKKKSPVAPPNGPFECNFSIKLGDNFIFSDNAAELREIFQGSTTLEKMGLSVKTGTVVWNQHKEKLSSESTDTLLIYNSNVAQNNTIKLLEFNNDEKKQYIRMGGQHEPIIVVNRGNGNSAYRLTYALVNEPTRSYLIENHLNMIYSKTHSPIQLSVLYEQVIESFKHKKTDLFIKSFLGNNGLSKTELETIFPIYL
jgi:tRNA1(Val) A37 N6-methylase TrmN6